VLKVVEQISVFNEFSSEALKGIMARKLTGQEQRDYIEQYNAWLTTYNKLQEPNLQKKQQADLEKSLEYVKTAMMKIENLVDTWILIELRRKVHEK
jgi:hypothetical protein